MNLSLPKINLFILLVSVLFIFSCKKNEINNSVNKTDLTTQVNASVSGFVTNENDQPVEAAEVKFGLLVSFTDKYGFFEIKNSSVVQSAAVVTILKQGYFKGTKTFIVSADRSAFCRIKLIPKTIAGTIDAANGGTVALSNGLKVELPANAVVNASTQSAYTGIINVASSWIDPTADGSNNSVPGDSWCTNKDGVLEVLKGYSMAAVELTGSSGELLQIATNKKAILTMPIPSSMLGNAPASISLGYFDEEKGYWKEEGAAVNTGNNYVAEVGHFSYWFCFTTSSGIVMTCRIVDAAGNPLKYTEVGVWSTLAGMQYTYTDNNGVILGNAAQDVYSLDILDAGCTVYTQAISVANQTATTYNGYYYPHFADIGNIVVPATALATIIGNVINCSGMPVTNGYVIFTKGIYNFNYRATLDNTGSFSFLTTYCSANQNIQLIAVDESQLQQSNILNFTPSNYGINNAGTLTACSVSAQEYINFSIDNNNYSFIYPADDFSQDYGFFAGINSSTNNRIYFQHQSLPVAIDINSTPNLQSFESTQYTADTLVSFPSIIVHFTEYGAVNEFISGSFSGTAIGMPPANTPHTLSCNFRVRRNN